MMSCPKLKRGNFPPFNDRTKQTNNKQPSTLQQAAETGTGNGTVAHPQLVARARFIDGRWQRVQLDGSAWPVLH
jgi:hypothetical protein